MDQGPRTPKDRGRPRPNDQRRPKDQRRTNPQEPRTKDYGCDTHPPPPSVVVKTRPVTVVTRAACALVAVTVARSRLFGNGTRENVRPSVDRRTTPPRPTIQQTEPDA